VALEREQRGIPQVAISELKDPKVQNYSHFDRAPKIKKKQDKEV